MIKSGKDVVFASKLIREGKLVAFPTETVYGLGANGFDAKAVARIFEVKRRPTFDPLILHIGEMRDLAKVFQKPFPKLVEKLAEKYWPGPLTIVAEKNSKVPDIVTAGLPGVAVRMPAHPMALKLIRQAGVPVAAPSANLFGRLSPTEAIHVKEQLTNIDYLLVGGRSDIGIESTIVAVTKNTIEILRPGAITAAQLTNDFPGVAVKVSDVEDHIQAPGQMKSHYSPVKPLYLVDEAPECLPARAGLMVFNPATYHKSFTAGVKILSETGDLLEAASNMFAALHEFELEEDIEIVYAIKVREEGIGMAIMDRLKKAAFRFSGFDTKDGVNRGCP
jgi:L-threonylcarbamoyladenylate synthase